MSILMGPESHQMSLQEPEYTVISFSHTQHLGKTELLSMERFKPSLMLYSN